MISAKRKTPPMRRRGARAMLAAFGVVAAAASSAEVRLEHSVSKVESFVNAAGAIERRLVDANAIAPGEELRYTIRFSNVGDATVEADSIVITNPIPDGAEYLEGTAFGAGTVVTFSVDGEHFDAPEALTLQDDGVVVEAVAKDYRAIRWTFQPELAPGEAGFVSFSVRMR